jgi:hypothetical protein
MAYDTKISPAAARAVVDALSALLDSGGYIEVRSGTKPANPSVAPSDGMLLGTLALSADAFGAAVDDAPNNRAQATVNTVSPDNDADNSAAPTWFRAYTSADAGVIDGTAGTAGTDMIVAVATIQQHSILSLVDWKIYHPW